MCVGGGGGLRGLKGEDGGGSRETILGRLPSCHHHHYHRLRHHNHLLSSHRSPPPLLSISAAMTVCNSHGLAPQEEEGREPGPPEDEDGEGDGGVLRRLRQLPELPDPKHRAEDRDRLVPLVSEAVLRRHSALVFCQSRKQCQSLAAKLSRLLPAAAPLAELNQQDAPGPGAAAWPPEEVWDSSSSSSLLCLLCSITLTCAFTPSLCPL